MSDTDLTEVRRMLFEGLGGRRYTQASPILPNVWLAFGERSDAPQDVLLTPDREPVDRIPEIVRRMEL